MTATYLREIEHARRDMGDLIGLVSLAGPVDLTRLELMTAIGLAIAVHDALLRAALARHEGPKA